MQILATLSEQFSALLGAHTVLAVLDRHGMAGGSAHDVAEGARRELAEILADF